jgi:hypothetical protein
VQPCFDVRDAHSLGLVTGRSPSRRRRTHGFVRADARRADRHLMDRRPDQRSHPARPVAEVARRMRYYAFGFLVPAALFMLSVLRKHLVEGVS